MLNISSHVDVIVFEILFWNYEVQMANLNQSANLLCRAKNYTIFCYYIKWPQLFQGTNEFHFKLSVLPISNAKRKWKFNIVNIFQILQFSNNSSNKNLSYS